MWKTDRLTDVSQVQTGKWDANHATKDGAYKFFTCAYESFACDTKRFEGDCLILPGNGVNVGEVFYFSGEFDAYQRTYVVSAIKINPKFLFYHMKCFWRDRNINKQYGSATNYLKIGNFTDYEVAYPPLPEQKRIVAILDEAFEGIDAAIANTEKNLANARELFDRYSDSIFTENRQGWSKTALGEIADFKNGLNFTKSSKGRHVNIVGVKDFKSNYWVPTKELDSIQIDGELSEIYELRRNDILTVRSNGNKQLIGRCMLVRDVPEKTSHSGFTIRIRNHSQDIEPTYLAHYLKSSAIREMLVNSGGGANISSLNQKTLSSMPVLFPSNEEQLKLVVQTEAVKADTNLLVANYLNKLSLLTQFKQSLLAKAFSGELTADSEPVLKEAVG